MNYEEYPVCNTHGFRLGWCIFVSKLITLTLQIIFKPLDMLRYEKDYPLQDWTHVRAVLASNFGRGTRYPVSYAIPQSRQVNSVIVPQIGHGPILPNIF
jgi:hypothetical protein